MQRRITLRTASSTSASLQPGSAPATFGEEDRKLTLSRTAAAKMLRRTSESDPVLRCRHSETISALSSVQFTRLPLCASTMPKGELT